MGLPVAATIEGGWDPLATLRFVPAVVRIALVSVRISPVSREGFLLYPAVSSSATAAGHVLQAALKLAGRPVMCQASAAGRARGPTTGPRSGRLADAFLFQLACGHVE